MGLGAPVAGHVELAECAAKARIMKSEKAHAKAVAKKKKAKEEKAEAMKPRRRRSSLEAVVETTAAAAKMSCSSTMKPVYIASWSFFMAGAIDDAVVYTHSDKQRSWMPFSALMFVHAGLVHLYCAVYCYYIEMHQAIDAKTRTMLKGPLVVLAGWMWKSAIIHGVKSLENSLTDVAWVESLIWIGFAVGLSVLFIYYSAWARRFKPWDVETEPAWSAVLRIASTISADSCVLPIAAIWDEALVRAAQGCFHCQLPTQSL